MTHRHPSLLSLALLLLLGACGENAKKTPTSGKDTTRTTVGTIDTSATEEPPSRSRSTPGGFAGEWIWTNERDQFSLSLDVEGAKISGHHEAYTEDGAHADVSAADDVSSINGTLKGNEATVDFRSNHAGVTGKARLTLAGDKLAWEILSVTPGDCFLPRKATLLRDDELLERDDAVHDESSGSADEATDGADTNPDGEGGNKQKK